MRKLKKYSTGYLVSDWEFYPPAPYKGKGWNITFNRTPYCGKSGATINGKIRIDKEVIINAPSFRTAQEALGHLNAAICLTRGTTQTFGEREVVQPL